jgi:hypothetical protein
MNRAFSVLILALAFCVAQPFAFADEEVVVQFKQAEGKYSAEYPEVIRVIRNSDNTLSFSICENASLQACRQIGSKERYKIRDIERLRSKLLWKIVRMTTSDLLFFATAGLAGSVASVLQQPQLTWTATASIFAIAGGLGVMPFKLMAYTQPDSVSPWTLFNNRQALTCSSKMNGIKTIKEPITDFAERLSGTLNKIY